jgi:hypothetical protein
MRTGGRPQFGQPTVRAARDSRSHCRRFETARPTMIMVGCWTQVDHYGHNVLMARKLDSFPGDGPSGQRRYPWGEWTDGSTWEIRRGEDYDVATENMRVNLHLKADAQLKKVRTKKVNDEDCEGLVFQFLDNDEMQEIKKMIATMPAHQADEAMEQLYADAIDIYERARREVMIPRSDGTEQKYAPVRYKRQIDKGWENGELVPTVARIVRKRTLGFGHLVNAGREDLLLETLILDDTKPYHRFFTEKTKELARERMREYGFLKSE